MVRRDLIGIEEQLLERYPELAAHHAVARRAGAQEITMRFSAMWTRRHADRKAARGVARLNRAARGQFVDGMLATWRELATEATHDYRPIARSAAKRWKRTGLGAARLSTLALPGNPEVKERMTTKRAQTR